MPTTLSRLALSGALGPRRASRAGRHRRPCAWRPRPRRSSPDGRAQARHGVVSRAADANGECPAAELTHVVEPWFLGGAPGPGGPELGGSATSGRARASASTPRRDVPAASGRPRLAIIAGRTADNSRLLREVIERRGVGGVMLEKPGAPTVAELEEMSAYAKSKGVGVFMGFNKNIARHAAGARGRAAAARARRPSSCRSTRTSPTSSRRPSATPRACSRTWRSTVRSGDLYGVTADSIADVSVDAANSESLTLGGRTDFSKVDHRHDDAGKKVAIFATAAAATAARRSCATPTAIRCSSRRSRTTRSPPRWPRTRPRTPTGCRTSSCRSATTARSKPGARARGAASRAARRASPRSRSRSGAQARRVPHAGFSRSSRGDRGRQSGGSTPRGSIRYRARQRCGRSMRSPATSRQFTNEKHCHGYCSCSDRGPGLGG